MNAIDRLIWHTRMAISKAHLWWDEAVCRRDITAEYNAAAERIPREERDNIERMVRELYEKKDPDRPKLDPRRTMLIHSRPDEFGCNAVTAPLYRQKLLEAVAWAQERGITAFLTDYYTPFGLLALETLLELREEGADFRVYAVRSCYFTQRRTYRAVPETGVEMCFLPARADYSYHDRLEDILTDIFPSAWTRCSEQGIWIAKSKIPPYLLEAWKN